MRVAISQSNYIPWKGYFDLINSVDAFVLYDCVQYTKNDWRNRNQVLVNAQPYWLTIPVHQASLGQLIQDTRTASSPWARKHWATLAQSYGRAYGFRTYADSLQGLYEQLGGVSELSRINRAFIDYICTALDITTRLLDARELEIAGERNARLVSMCQQLGATTYVSGPSARDYLDVPMFTRAGIAVQWFEYGPYEPYEQAGTVFHDHVSVLDLLLNTGDEAKRFFQRTRAYA